MTELEISGAIHYHLNDKEFVLADDSAKFLIKGDMFVLPQHGAFVVTSKFLNTENNNWTIRAKSI